jgi:hypothetical protein
MAAGATSARQSAVDYLHLGKTEEIPCAPALRCSYLPALAGRGDTRLAGRRRTLRVFRAILAFLRVRAARLPLLTSLLLSRRTLRVTACLVKAFCAASALAAIAPKVDPIDSATLMRSARSFEDLRDVFTVAPLSRNEI